MLMAEWAPAVVALSVAGALAAGRLWQRSVVARAPVPCPDPAIQQRAARSRSTAIGAVGEALVASIITGLRLPVLRNLVLIVAGRTVEMDALVLTGDGLIVLEVKTLSGLIVPTNDGAVWERLGRGVAVRFQSPVVQNRWHVDALRRFLADDRVPVSGLVVSAGTATLAPELRSSIVLAHELGRVPGLAYRGEPAPHIMYAWRRLGAERCRSAARLTRHIGSCAPAGRHDPSSA